MAPDSCSCEVIHSTGTFIRGERSAPKAFAVSFALAATLTVAPDWVLTPATVASTDKPGRTVCIVAVTLFDIPAALVTVTATGPVFESDGASTLIFVGLTYCRNAALPSICTLAPPNEVGNALLTISAALTVFAAE